MSKQQDIEAGIVRATTVDGPWEFGLYIERRDHGEWTPLIYPEMTEAQAQSMQQRHAHDDALFRHARVVCRPVSPWEVYG